MTSALARYVHYVTRAARAAANTLLPASCPACNQPTQSGTICAHCWQDMGLAYCPHCHRAAHRLCNDGECRHASHAADAPHYQPHPECATPHHLSNIRAPLLYEGVTRKLIHDWKYRGRLINTALFATITQQAGADILGRADYLVPVPLHWRRLLSRQFNQAAELARALHALRTKHPSPTIPSRPPVPARHRPTRLLLSAVRRHRYTQPQLRLSRSERAANLDGAFSINPRYAARIAGTTIVIIDDVITSGATVNQVGKLLRETGAARVDALAIASVSQ